MSSSVLGEGIAAVKAGELARARRLLMAVLDQDPYSESAWLWLALAVEDPRRQRQCLESALRLNPDSEVARKGLALLAEKGSLIGSLPGGRRGAGHALSRRDAGASERVVEPAMQVVPVYDARNSLLVAAVLTLVILVCALPLVGLFTGPGEEDRSAGVDDQSAGQSNARAIPPTWTPGSSRSNGESSSSPSISGSYGEIAISRPRLAEFAERSALAMDFYRDLEYTDGTYHHTMCTDDCRHKLVMRSETYDRSDLDNLDYSFIYSTEDEFVQSSLSLLSVLGLAVPEWEEEAFEWYIEGYEAYVETGRETIETRRNGLEISVEFYWDAVDMEEAVILGVYE